ncbi:MAG: hypothetical protein BWY69_01416 [Planctomycetes bacterium ADurb.Bin401]|nr:MAG: hypothetical protein BWY69_01416 [Planctomycetes bacterium ADurb.Bin401]
MKIKLRTILTSLAVLAAVSLTFYAYCGCKGKKILGESKPECCHSSDTEKPVSQKCPGKGNCCLEKIPPAAPVSSQTLTSDNFFISVYPENSLIVQMNNNVLAEGNSTGPPFKYRIHSVLCVFII